MTTHFTASGWLLEDDDDGLLDLVSHGAVQGRQEMLDGQSEYRVLTSSDRRFEFWLFAAHGQVRGAVPYVRSTLTWRAAMERQLPRVTGGMGAVELRRVDGKNPTVCVELPDYGCIPEIEPSSEVNADITGLAYACRTIPEDEVHLCVPRFDPFGLRNDAAVSMGEGSRCDVIACGPITRVERLRNDVTGLEVWIVELDACGLPLCTAASVQTVEGDEPRVGRLYEGVFWLVGRLEVQKRGGVLAEAMRRLNLGG